MVARACNKKLPLLTKKSGQSFSPRSQRCLRTECLLSAVVLGLMALFVTLGSSTIVKAGYELVQARACLIKIEKENEILHLEMARLKSPQRIREIASNQLGMLNPPSVYMADQYSGEKNLNMDGAAETHAPRSFVLFGSSRAEARNIVR